MRDTVKTIRDAELSLLKKMGKGKGAMATYDPKKPKAVRVYVATKFPEWQDVCVGAVKEAWDDEKKKVDDAKVRSILAEKGLIKEKRAMPFVQLFKVRLPSFLLAFIPASLFSIFSHSTDDCIPTLSVLLQKRIADFGAETAFRRALPFSESQVLGELLPYLKRTLNLEDGEVMSADDALAKAGEPGFTKSIIESSEPGAPAFEFRNV